MINAEIGHYDQRTSLVLAELVDANNGGNAKASDAGNLTAKTVSEPIARFGKQLQSHCSADIAIECLEGTDAKAFAPFDFGFYFVLANPRHNPGFWQ
jgi:hypothetical protein